MTRRERALLAAAGLVGLMALAVWVASRLESYEVTVAVAPTGEARRNPLLAAERLLSSCGIPARSVRDLQELPPLDHVLLLAAEDRILTSPRASRVADWVASGGTLIVGPHLVAGRLTSESGRDPLLSALGANVVELEASGAERIDTPIDFGDGAFVVSFPAQIGIALATEEDEGAGEESLAHDVVRLDHGAGRAFVLSDLRFAHNDRIGQLDHAPFLLALVLSDGAPAGVRILYSERRPTLWKSFPGRAWPALLGAALVGLGAAWRAGSRFGPLLPRPTPVKRSLAEHVEAVGRFLWRQRRADVLLSAARAELLRTAGRSRPGPQRRSTEEQAAWLVTRSEVSRGEIEWALGGRTTTRRDEFLRAVRILLSMRRRL